MVYVLDRKMKTKLDNRTLIAIAVTLLCWAAVLISSSEAKECCLEAETFLVLMAAICISGYIILPKSDLVKYRPNYPEKQA